MYEEKKEEKDFMHKVLKNLLDFHPLILSGISLVSMICYFVYFGIFIGYFPVLSGSDIFYIGALLFTIVAILSLFIVSIMLLYGWYYIKPNNKPSCRNNYLAALLAIPPTAILIMQVQYKELTIIIILFVLYIVIYFILCFACCLICCLLKQSRFVVVFLVILDFICLTIFSNIIVDTKDTVLLLILYSFVYICVIFLVFAFIEYIFKDKNPQLFMLTFAVMLFIVIFYYLSDDIAKKFEISNIEYEYLSIEKSVLGALPKGICEKKEKDSIRTYYDANDISNVVMLYNIKALSTLGKFYYLEAIGCENNEKIRFELDASKIISRKKQER